MSKKDRERVGMDSEKLMELCDGLYYEGTIIFAYLTKSIK